MMDVLVVKQRVLDARTGVNVVVLTDVVVVVTEEVGFVPVIVLVLAVRVIVDVLMTFAMPAHVTAVG
jgi:hypothetical protein